MKDLNEYTVEELRELHNTASAKAHAEASTFLKDVMDGQDRGMCGFAWVDIRDIKGNTKLGRKLKQIGLTQDYKRCFSVWNPAQFGVQSVDVLEAGAVAYAKAWQAAGFNAIAGSRLD